MIRSQADEENQLEIYEDAFVNIKEACLRLQERTKCSNTIVIKMLNDVADFYIKQKDQNQISK